MKTNIFLTVLLVISIAIVSCKKDTNEISDSNLNASKTEKIKLSEPVLFKLAAVPVNSQVTWKILPETDAVINAAGNTATIQFNTSGNYTINATFEQVRDSASVSVIDSIYNPGTDNWKIVPLTGDQVYFNVSKIDSMGLDGLAFFIETENKYACLNHTLLHTLEASESSFKITMDGIFIPGDEFCEEGESVAKSATSLYPLTEGTYTFQVQLDGVLYSGSFTKNGPAYTFDWPYTSGVIISPLVIH